MKSKVLFLYHTPDRGLIVQGRDGMYLQKLFSANTKLAAEGYSFLLHIQIAPGYQFLEAHGSSTVIFQPAEELV